MKKTVSFALAVLMAFAPIPAPALAEAIEEPIVLTQDEAGVADQTEEVLLLDGQGTASDAGGGIELGAESDEPDESDEPAIAVQDGESTPKFHIQTAQVQGINGTTLTSGPNYKHVPTTYYYDLNKGDYPVPYRSDGWPLNYSNYMQASGIYFPGDKIVFIPEPDPTPFNGAHGLPGKVIHNEKGEYGEYAKGDRIGPLLVSGSVTLGSWHTHTYITELTVVDGPVMFSTESGNSGASGWADSGPDDYGHATEWWPVSSIRYIELPKYHPVEYHYYCGDAEIPASDLANAFYYPNQPANPQVIWAEDLSSSFIPYETGMGYNTWTKFRAGNVFTFSRPYIEGYYYLGMEIGTHNDNYWCWEPTNSGDSQSYTARFRYDGDTDYNWTFTNQKEGNEADPIVVKIKYTRDSEYPSTITVDANGGTIEGRSEQMYNFRYYYDYENEFDPKDHMPTRDGYVFDGYYADAACTQIITPAADNGKDLSGDYKMYESDVKNYLKSYGRTLRSDGAHHFRVYAKWAPQAAKHVNDLEVGGVTDKIWTGSAITQTPVIKDGDTTLTAGTDYRILGYEDNVDVGTAKMRIQGIGNYRGYRVVRFYINKKPVTINFGLEYDTVTYDGTDKRPAIKNFSCSESGLAYNDTNFYTSYSYNRDASTSSTKAKVTISARGNNYTGSTTKEFTIKPRKITPTVVLGFTKTTYNGEAQYPPVTVKDGDTVISSYSYTVDVTNNVEVGTATDTVTLKGNYEGTGKATFQIVPATKTLSVAVDASYTGDEQVYDAWYKRPDLVVKSGSTVLTEGTDYTVDYKDNYYPGTATATVTGVGAYAGATGKTTFQIKKPNIGTGDYTGKVFARRYTGQAVTPKPALYVEIAGYGWVTLYEGSEYTVESYQNNVEVGQATMTIKGMGYFTGTAILEFSIVEREGDVIDMSDAELDSFYETYNYSGYPIRPNPYVYVKRANGGYQRLTRGNDYDVAYKNNVEPGTATITITGTNDYVGSLTRTFQIVDPDAELEDVADATVTVAAQTYKGKALKPAPTVMLGNKTLVKDTDYTVTYANNTKAGTATLTITGVRAAGYKGTKSVTFSIAKAKISKAAATIATQAYTGKALTPEPTLTYSGKTLVNGTDYTLAYANNVKVGTATITVTGKKNFKGTKSVTFAIAKLKATPAKTSYAYTGKAITPAITVKMGSTTLKKDTHYAVKYASGRKAVGTYSVKVTLKGSYAGTKKTSFTIVPKATSISSLAAGSKAFTVAWKKQATETTGYNVEYSLKKDFSSAKNVTVSKTSTVSKKIAGLKANKTYYVRVRTYKTVGDKTYDSAWSAVKTVTTKA